MRDRKTTSSDHVYLQFLALQFNTRRL